MIMMREKFESLRSSLGAVIPRWSGSRHYQLLSTSPGSQPMRHPLLQEFESKLAEKLDGLRKVGEELGFLRIDWLLQALSVVVSTHADVQALIPNLTHKDEKWMREYLDDSTKLLEVRNFLQKGIEDVGVYPKLMQAAIPWLEGEGRSYYRARNALRDCMDERWRGRWTFGRELELEYCSFMLRTMGKKKLVNPKTSGNGFFKVAMYGAKVTTIFLCGFVVSALASRKSRHLGVKVHVSRHCLCASSLLSLQQRVKEETDKRKTESGSVALLAELDSADVLVRRLHGVVDKKLKSSIPLLGELHTVDVLMRRFHGVIEKSTLVVNTSEAEELHSLVASLDARSKSLLDSLHRCADVLSSSSLTTEVHFST